MNKQAMFHFSGLKLSKYVIVFFFLFVIIMQIPNNLIAGNQIIGDPMVKITALPIEQDLREILSSISLYVSEETGLDEGFVTYYWQTFDAIYCPGCETVDINDPIFVDLYVPSFITIDERIVIMRSIAEAIAKYTDYSIEEIFLHTHIAEKDQLFMNGDIITNWDQVGGPDDSKNTEKK